MLSLRGGFLSACLPVSLSDRDRTSWISQLSNTHVLLGSPSSSKPISTSVDSHTLSLCLSSWLENCLSACTCVIAVALSLSMGIASFPLRIPQSVELMANSIWKWSSGLYYHYLTEHITLSKPQNWRIPRSSETLIGGFWSSEIVKYSIGLFFFSFSFLLLSREPDRLSAVTNH